MTPDTGDGDVGDAGDAGDSGEESSPAVAFSVPKSVLNAIAENAKQAQVINAVTGNFAQQLGEKAYSWAKAQVEEGFDNAMDTTINMFNSLDSAKDKTVAFTKDAITATKDKAEDAYDYAVTVKDKAVETGVAVKDQVVETAVVVADFTVAVKAQVIKTGVAVKDQAVETAVAVKDEASKAMSKLNLTGKEIKKNGGSLIQKISNKIEQANKVDLWMASETSISASAVVTDDSFVGEDAISAGKGISYVRFLNMRTGDFVDGLYVFDITEATGDKQGGWASIPSAMAAAGPALEHAFTFSIQPRGESKGTVLDSYTDDFYTDTAACGPGIFGFISSDQWYGPSMGLSGGIGGGYADITTDYKLLTSWK